MRDTKSTCGIGKAVVQRGERELAPLADGEMDCIWQPQSVHHGPYQSRGIGYVIRRNFEKTDEITGPLIKFGKQCLRLFCRMQPHSRTTRDSRCKFPGSQIADDHGFGGQLKQSLHGT